MQCLSLNPLSTECHRSNRVLTSPVLIVGHITNPIIYLNDFMKALLKQLYGISRHTR